MAMYTKKLCQERLKMWLDAEAEAEERRGGRNRIYGAVPRDR